METAWAASTSFVFRNVAQKHNGGAKEKNGKADGQNGIPHVEGTVGYVKELFGKGCLQAAPTPGPEEAQNGAKGVFLFYTAFVLLA